MDNASSNDTPKKKAAKAPRSRFTPQPNAGLRLEERDEHLLADLFLHRLMSREQLQSLYFTSRVRCNARLRQLFDHGFVTRYYPPAAIYGAQAVYSIGKAAVPVVARELEMDTPQVANQYRLNKTPTFIEHTLAIVDVRVAFLKAVASRDDLEIDLWLPEIRCRHEYEIRTGASGGWRKEVFKPDAFIRLRQRCTHATHSYFVEVDLGHTSSSQFAGKLLSHRRYLESGLFVQIYGTTSFETLVITVGEKRLRNLCRLADERNIDSFMFSTFERLASLAPLGATWQSAESQAPRTIIPMRQTHAT